MLISFKKPEANFEQAVIAHQQGRLPEAESIYRQVLAENPNHADALHMLGLLAHQSGNVAAGMELIERSVALAPQNASALSNLGELKRAALKLDEAESFCRRALALAPNLGPAHINLSMIMNQKGKPEEALKLAMRAVELSPKEAAAYSALAMAFAELQRLPDAIRAFEEAIKLNPNDAGAAASLSMCYSKLEMHDKAYMTMHRAVALAPNNPQIVLNMGSMLASIERFAESAQWLEKTLALKPDLLIAQEHLAGVKVGLKQFEEAIELCRKIIAAHPDAMDTYATMGEAMMNLGQFEECIAAMKQALAFRPSPGVLQSLSNAYVRAGRPAEGLATLQKALDLAPQNAVLHFNKAIILLLMGRLQEAWPEYEWRWQHPRMVGRTRRFQKPLWDGKARPGQRVLFHAEQGMGDTIFFGRYASKAAKELGVVPIMWVQNVMVDLVKTIPGVAEVIGEAGPVPPFDYQMAIMSTPGVFNTSLETIPTDIPYIKSDPKKKEYWKNELARRTSKFKIGLVWEGGAFQPENFLRSNSLAAYAPLADVQNVAFFGMQKGPAEEQCKNPPPGMDFTNLAPYLTDFTDTAAILDNLDLLISIDTSVIHVAGALGKPVWMLLAWSPGHMWMYERTDTPWYPQIRIFRQPAFKDWATPVARVKAELNKLVNGA